LPISRRRLIGVKPNVSLASLCPLSDSSATSTYAAGADGLAIASAQSRDCAYPSSNLLGRIGFGLEQVPIKSSKFPSASLPPKQPFPIQVMSQRSVAASPATFDAAGEILGLPIITRPSCLFVA